MAISSIATSGEFAQTNNCGSSLPSASSHEINLTFSPKSMGEQTGTLAFSYGAPLTQQMVLLSGSGVGAPSITLSATSLSFGSMLVEPLNLSGYGMQQFFVGNRDGAGPLSISNVLVTGQGFSVDNNCGYGLPAGAPNTCSIDVLFYPPGLGVFSGTLQLYDTAAGSPQTISLSGQGTNFTLGTAADPVITESLPFTVMFGMASSPNSTETVALSCSVSPASSYQCQLSQNSVLFTGSRSRPRRAR